MEREDAKNLTLSVLVVAVIVLLADCVWLHVKCSRQGDAIATQAAAISSLNVAFQAHINPPPEPSMADKAKEVYERAKTATVRQYEKVKSAAAAQYRAATGKLRHDQN